MTRVSRTLHGKHYKHAALTETNSCHSVHTALFKCHTENVDQEPTKQAAQCVKILRQTVTGAAFQEGVKCFQCFTGEQNTHNLTDSISHSCRVIYTQVKVLIF